MTQGSTRFQSIILPGLTFKAVVIGGGYATGRELAEFFGHLGPMGGLVGLAVSALVWSMICSATFMYAYTVKAENYKAFFGKLLGPFWWAFEVLFILLCILVMAVICAAAGEIGSAILGLPLLVGQVGLIVLTALVVAFGSELVEKVFRYTSFVLYGAFLTLLGLALNANGATLLDTLNAQSVEVLPVLEAGFSFSGYNVVGAVVVLAVVRHFQSRKDAALAGLLCGPLAVLPGFIFFLCLLTVPSSLTAPLPSDALLSSLDFPAFRVLYQLVILVALLETGVGCLHAINERIGASLKAASKDFGPKQRFATALVILIIAGIGAGSFGLIALIAGGYRFISFGMFAVFVIPVLTLGMWTVFRGKPEPA